MYLKRRRSRPRVHRDEEDRAKLCLIGKTEADAQTTWLTLQDFYDFYAVHNILGHAILKPETMEMSEFDEVLEQRMAEFDYDAAQGVITGLLSSRYARMFTREYEPSQGPVRGKGPFLGASVPFIPLPAIKVSLPGPSGQKHLLGHDRVPKRHRNHL